jgi:hypothetical protein
MAEITLRAAARKMEGGCMQMVMLENPGSKDKWEYRLIIDSKKVIGRGP